MRHNLRTLCVLLVAIVARAQVPSPESVIGFAPGTAGMLADYPMILDYFRKLDAASDRVQMEVSGKSTEGRDLVLAVISSPENLARIDAIREDNARLADPRGVGPGDADPIIARGKVILLVNESIHSSEVGPSQAGMATAHFLASTEDPAWKKVLADTVILLNPCHNPDGYDTVVHWWNRHKDDPKTRGAPLPVLYHKYVGHDNNRDWFMFTQAETRVTVQDMHLRWHPQIVVDQHQMGRDGPRMFIPPYQEPWEPNVHPLLREGLEDLGRSVIKGMSEQGLRGVICNRMFDAWSPARAYMHYHGGVRVLTEVASVDGADPVVSRVLGPGRRGGGTASDASKVAPDDPLPWQGGQWTLADIVRYCKEAVLLSARNASDHRERWLRNFAKVHRDPLEDRSAPRGFLIKVDQPRLSALRKLVDILTLGGVNLETTREEFIVAGNTCPPGTLFIPPDQSFFPFAKALLVPTPYPEIRTQPGGPIRRPYDVTAHCLPLLMNLEVHAIPRGPMPKSTLERFDPSTLRVDDKVFGDILLDPRDEGAHADALRALAAGEKVERVREPKGGLPAGAFLIRSGPNVKLTAAKAHAVPNGLKGEPLKSPRLGVYWSWMANMDEGWLRFFFDTLGIAFTPLRDADLRAGSLGSKYDAIVIASLNRVAIVEGQSNQKLEEKYRGGIGKEGETALKSFVEGGGTLVTLNTSSALATKLFDLPLKTLPERRSGRTPEGEETAGAERGETGRSAPQRCDIPGAILAATVDPAHPIGFGASKITPIFFNQDHAFVLTNPSAASSHLSFPVRFAKKNTVLCGFAEGAEALQDGAAVAVARIGKGHAVLFSFSPHFRNQTWSTFTLLLNALHL